MSEFTYPGVYIKEIPSGPGPISGVTTSNLGLIGFTTRGPVDYPTLVTSYTEYVSKFGTFTADALSPTMAYAFFQNGGQRLYQVRVAHADAAEALWDYELTATAEVLGITAAPSGLYDLQLDHMPVKVAVPGTCTVTFDNAVPATVNRFIDNGLGVMVWDGLTGTGGTGSIDYESGEITIQLAAPGEYVGGAQHIHATYTYRVLRFEMKWPGAVGNFFQVILTPGSDDYLTAATASWSRFTVTVQEDLNQDPANRAWSTLETFADMVFSDPTDKSYLVTVMNDTVEGSQYLTVTDYGNAINPPVLAGAQYLNENLYTNQQHSDGSSVVVPDPYDGAWKGWQYQLAHDVFPTTLLMDFQFIEDGTRIGTGAAPAAVVPILTWTAAPVVAGTFDVTCDLTGGGVGCVLADDGAGHLTFSGFNVGTIIYATGALAIDLTLAGDTFVAGSALTLDCTYAVPVRVIDDGSGALTIDTTVVGYPTKFALNTAGTNTVDYDTGEVVITWKIVGDPAAGPWGTFTLSTPATKVSTAGPWALTPGIANSFTLAVDAVPAAPVAFVATQGYIDTTNVWPGANEDGNSITFAVNGVNRTVTFGGIGGPYAEADFMLQVNAQIPGIACYDDGAANARTISDKYGTSSTLAIVANTTGFTFAAPVHAPGDNVADIESISALEFETIVEAACLTAHVAVVGNVPTTTGTVLGAAGLLTFADVTPGITVALGLGVSPVTVHGVDSLTGGELADYYDDPAASLTGVLTGGLDGSATDSLDIVSPLLAGEMRGLYAFGKVDELMQLVAADFQSDTYVIDSLLTYAELMHDKFVICAVPYSMEYADAVTWKKFSLNRYSSYGALYYPHVKIKDPITGTNVDVPPGGHVAGVYARTDANKNVGKAPAGVEDGVLAWSVGLEYTLTPTQVGVLTENKINCLVEWPYTGRCVWGARSLDIAGGEWPYLQMRRLFMFVEKSVFKATHVHIFKNNGPQLWNEITTQLTNFLLGLYQGGYFAGSTPEDAFFVICNSTNNPQNTIDQGIVFCDVGIACNKPAEYLVFRFSQKSLS